MGGTGNLTRVDHNDFFTRAYGVLLTVYDKQSCCLPAQPKFSTHYQSFRSDYGADMAYLLHTGGGRNRIEVSLDLSPHAAGETEEAGGGAVVGQVARPVRRPTAGERRPSLFDPPSVLWLP